VHTVFVYFFMLFCSVFLYIVCLFSTFVVNKYAYLSVVLTFYIYSLFDILQGLLYDILCNVVSLICSAWQFSCWLHLACMSNKIMCSLIYQGYFNYIVVRVACLFML